MDGKTLTGCGLVAFCWFAPVGFQFRCMCRVHGRGGRLVSLDGRLERDLRPVPPGL